MQNDFVHNIVQSDQLEKQIQVKSQSIQEVIRETEQVVVGQKDMLEGMVMAFLCDGHVLLEGLPGLAKTLAVSTLSKVLDLEFNRIQFTPDLLPSDVIGSMVYNQKTNEFTPKKGPIFANIVLADEINRAPAKVQSALLEAMSEKQVTIGGETYKLDKPFVVLATQNPIEQEGTYALPEAQLDRFLFKVKVHYPKKEEEKLIIDRMTRNEIPKVTKTVLPKVIEEAKSLTTDVFIDEKLKSYILDIIFASRFPGQYYLDELKPCIQVGGSPRASINMVKASKAKAFLSGRAFVTPDDIKSVAYDILRHRLILTYEAEANDLTSEAIIRKILDAVQVP